MKLIIDNRDGVGPVDYSGAILSSPALALERKLNAPSTCTFHLIVSTQSLSVPVRYGTVSLSDDLGNVLFTGYVSATPVQLLNGLSTTGPTYRISVTAISDELLLDTVLSLNQQSSINQTAAATLQTVTSQSGGSAFSLSPDATTAAVGRFYAPAGTRWSAQAASLAASARSAYRVVSGVVELMPTGSVVHSLSESDGSLQLSGLQVSNTKLFANDVTVCGAIEPAAYVSEIFQGDGVTAKFALTELPFEASASQKLNLVDLFQQSTLNPLLWDETDSSSRLSITYQGLTCTGGSGRDAETVVSAIQQIELGGSIVIEAGGIQFQGACAGVLAGLYFGSVAIPNCLAGFQISTVQTAIQISPLIDGAVSGASFTVLDDHQYTLRLRVYCSEMERVSQSYYYLGSAGIASMGGEYVQGGGYIVLESQDTTDGVPGVPVTLYDGAIAALPPVATLGLLNSGNLNCSIKTISCKRSSPLWATSTISTGTAQTLDIATAAAGGNCSLSSTGNLTFYPAFIPPAGALITVSYRTKYRSVARRSTANPALAPEPPTAMWIGTVREPAAWSSRDCDNAALALLQASAQPAAGWEGRYVAINADGTWDVWPGDVLAISSQSSGITANVVVREVLIQPSCTIPETLKYSVRFANDWAEDLAIRVSATVPEDVFLPQQPAVTAPLANLNALTLTSVSATVIAVSTNLTPPTGGGFEVKRRDWTFGPGVDSDLVLRSPVANFTIPRSAPVEQYYVRMYDASSPPNYSEFSAGIFINVPM